MDLSNLFIIFSCEAAPQGEVKRFLQTTEILTFKLSCRTTCKTQFIALIFLFYKPTFELLHFGTYFK